MTNLTCNFCGTSQKAKVFEVVNPVYNQYLSRSFLLVIERCQKCNQKKIRPVGFLHSGELVKFGYIKPKDFKKVEIDIIKELERLPAVDVLPQRGGFYLFYSDLGTVKPCFENLSSMQLGKDKNWDLDYGRKPTKLLQSR